MERAGLPTAHICAIVPVAFMVGSNRIIPAAKIVNPLGNENLEPEEEKKYRRAILVKALEALQEDVKEQTLFE